MRRARVLTWASSLLLFGAAAHCGSDDTPPGVGGPDSGGPIAVPEGGSTPDAGNDAPVGPTTCSPAGWCESSLPDDDLVFKSIWPLERRAFATVESPTLGYKVLEWNIEDDHWKYIDDNRQNQNRRTTYISSIWAPSDNEIYYAISKGTIVHGVRSAPDQPWTWTFTVLEDHSPTRPTSAPRDYPYQAVSHVAYPTLGVWGTSADDVYAWYINTVFHWTSKDGGAPSWVAEYTADDLDDDPKLPEEELFALGATGSGPDDMWFSFVRTDMQWEQGVCPIVVRKTAAGYQRISDGFLVAPPPDIFGRIGAWLCKGPRAGLLTIDMQPGWLTPLESIGNGQVAGILGGRQLMKIAANATGGGYTVANSMILSFPVFSTPFFGSLYAAADERLWVAGTGPTGAGGIVVSANRPWTTGEAGGGYEVSSATLTGAPLEGSSYKVRGTSNTNLWLVGTHHALHKTKL